MPSLGKNKLVRLTIAQHDEIMRIYSSIITRFLSPVIELGDVDDVIKVCCCCMDSMASHFSGDIKAERLDCGHEVCTGCISQILSASLKVPVHLVSCPLCRSVVSFGTLDKACGGAHYGNVAAYD